MFSWRCRRIWWAGGARSRAVCTPSSATPGSTNCVNLASQSPLPAALPWQTAPEDPAVLVALGVCLPMMQLTRCWLLCRRSPSATQSSHTSSTDVPSTARRRHCDWLTDEPSAPRTFHPTQRTQRSERKKIRVAYLNSTDGFKAIILKPKASDVQGKGQGQSQWSSIPTLRPCNCIWGQGQTCGFRRYGQGH